MFYVLKQKRFFSQFAAKWPHFLADEVVGLAQHVSPVRVPQQDPVAADACDLSRSGWSDLRDGR